jgi:hypothetical protein
MEYTERQHAMLAARRTVQPALQLGVAVSYAEHWAGWPGKQLYGAVGTCTVLSMLLPTGLIAISALAQAVKHNQPAERNAAGSKAISHKVLAMSAAVCCTLCMELTKTLAYGCTVEESVCLSGAGRQHSNPHARRRLDARVELVYQCLRNLQCLVRTTETQCMIQLYLQQQSSATC